MRGIIRRLLGETRLPTPPSQAPSSEELREAHARLTTAAGALSDTIDDTFAELVRRSTGTSKKTQIKRRRRS